jgi:hypothetical protein
VDSSASVGVLASNFATTKRDRRFKSGISENATFIHQDVVKLDDMFVTSEIEHVCFMNKLPTERDFMSWL